MTFSELPFKQKVKFMLAAWGAISSFALIVMLFYVIIPEGQKTLVNTLVTLYVTGSMINVYTFYFGDSDAMEPR